jgi:hypothetical protein
MHDRGIRLVASGLVVSALLAACSLTSLFLPQGDLGFSSLDPYFSLDASSSEIVPVTLRHGTATITITSGEPRIVELPHLSGDSPSMVLPGFGQFVTWRGGDWALKLEGGSLMGVGSPTLTIVREDVDPSLQADGNTCTVTYTAQTPTHLAGRAVCTGLAWVDVLSNPMDLPVPSGPPTFDHPLFDATIVFDATP